MPIILIKNGTVIDPGNKMNQIADVAVENGKIIAIGAYEGRTPDFVVDAADCVITPGLVDNHIHVYPLMPVGVPAEAMCFSSGVTTVSEAGSAGTTTYTLHRNFLELSKLNIKCWMHVCPTGLSMLPTASEDVDPAHFQVDKLENLFARYPEDLVGLKLRTSKEVVKELGYEPLRQVVKVADQLNVPVMVHCTNPCGPMSELLDILRPGDILTHSFQNIGSNILDEAREHIAETTWAARKKGVIFDTGDARGHFSFEVGEIALAEGFYPDTISTDLTIFGMNTRPGPFNLAMVMNKYINMGMPEEEVIRCCTENPAKALGIYPQVGSLRVGGNADIAVFKRVDVPFEFGDRPYANPDCVLRQGKIRLHPVMTLKDGEIVYRDMFF